MARKEVLKVKDMRLKWIGRYDPRMPLLRLARVMWQRGVVGDGHGYSAALTLGLRPKLWQWNRGTHDLALTIVCVRLHYKRSYGGKYV